MPTVYRNLAHRLLLLALLGAASCSSANGAEAGNFDIDIPARPLADALATLSRQIGIPVLYEGDLTQGVQSAAVRGRLSPDAALRQLLQGTGLSFRHGVNGGISLFKPESKPSASQAPQAPDTVHALPKVKVTAAAIKPEEDPYNTDYNRTNATTATKTDTPIMETPLNIQVVPQQVLKDQQVVRIEKALQNVSGVYTVPGSGAQNGFILRGFKTFQYYVDGLRINSNGDSYQRETSNLEQIDVLKGPASILYGRLDPGGLVNVVRKKPLATSYLDLQQQFGSFDFYRTTVDATGPLTDDNALLYRLNLAYENAGSFREFVSNERVFVAPRLRWNPSPRTQVDVFIEYLNDQRAPDFGIPALGSRPAAIPRERNLGEPGEKVRFEEVRSGLDWSHAFNDQWTVRQRIETAFSADQQGPSLFPTSFPDALTCTAAGCPIDRALIVNNIDRQTVYTSFNVSGKFDTGILAHTLLLGSDYFRQDDDFQLDQGSTVPTIDLFRPVHIGRVPVELLNPLPYRFKSQSTEDWYGFYLQDQVKLPFDLHLLGGFRYDNAGLRSDQQTIVPNSPIDASRSTLQEDAVTPRFGVLWRPLSMLSLYGNYVEGFGLNNGRNPNRAPLPPETSQQWEVGLKTEYFGGRLSSTLAWFDLTKQNVATVHPDPRLAALGFSATTGEVRNQGLEFDISGAITEDISFIGSYAYIQSDITKDRQAIYNNDFSKVIGFNTGNQGNRLFGVPRHGGSLWLSYAPKGGFWDGLKLGAGAIVRSQAEGDNENDFEIPGYVTANLMLGYTRKVGRSKISIQLNIDNLFNKEYFDSAGTRSSQIAFGTPQSFLGSVRLEF